MAFIDGDGVHVSYANPADEALAFAVADSPWSAPAPQPACPWCNQPSHAKACQPQRLADLLQLHAAAWWRDIEAYDYITQVNATYAAYQAGGGSNAHYDAHWRAFSDAAKHARYQQLLAAELAGA